MIKINKIAALLVLTLCSTSSVGAQNLDGDLFELFPEYIKSVSPSKLWASYVLDSLKNEKEDILRFIDILKGDAYPQNKQEELLLNMLVTHIKARNSGVDEYLLNELSSIDNEYSKVASLKLKDITDFANDYRKKESKYQDRWVADLMRELGVYAGSLRELIYSGKLTYKGVTPTAISETISSYNGGRVLSVGGGFTTSYGEFDISGYNSSLVGSSGMDFKFWDIPHGLCRKILKVDSSIFFEKRVNNILVTSNSNEDNGCRERNFIELVTK